MKSHHSLRLFVAGILGATSAVLVLASFQIAKPIVAPGPRLAFEKLNRNVVRPDKNRGPLRQPTFNPNIPLPNAPTFGHPVISGIGGFGYEENLRPDPTDPTHIYTSVPGSAAADTSWIWRSLDTGKTFKWVPAALAFTGKVNACHGGGDTELAVDSAGHLYFNDLTLANFSTWRSDDFGASFGVNCTNVSVPDAVVDRQWYAVDGDPTNGGTIYLANDEVGNGGVQCGNGIGGTAGNNVLVMYRSPVTGMLGTTAGIIFGPPNHVTSVLSCDEGIMGNNEISPIATKTGQPNGPGGGFTQLGTAVKHIYVVHDNNALNQVRIGRCFPVAFGLPVTNVSDPSGLNCTDLLVKDLGANARTGGNFPTMAIDKSGNLYAVWEQAPTDPNSNIIGDTVLMYSYSLDEGNTWSTPIQIDTSGSPDGVLHNNVFGWIAAGDDGRVNIAWYGTTGLSNPNDSACGQNGGPVLPPSRNINGPDATTGAFWSVWFTQSLNAHDANPIFAAPIRASEHFNHLGTIQTLLGGQCGDRQGLGDFMQLRTGAQGEAEISYADSNSITHTLASHAMFVRQNGGTGLYAAQSPLSVSGIKPYNVVLDPAGDGKYEANGTSSTNMPQLDIVGSSVSLTTSAPCSPGAPCYKVFMQLNNLSLAPTPAQDPDPDLVWSTQWFVPSTTDSTGGRDFHVYAESTNGGALQCFTGQNAVFTAGGGYTALSYPGTSTPLPAENCQSTLGPNGTITIYLPLSMVSEAGAIDNRLHEVTASTMTLTQPANTSPDLLGTGLAGTLFNLIDVAQGYVFDPILSSAVSRKVHGTAGAFDIDLLTGGIEDRSGGATNDYQVVVTFASPITLGSANVVPGSGATASLNGAPISSGNQLTINLTNVSNAQRLTINLVGVNDGTNTRDLAIPMAVLTADTNADGFTDAIDVSQTKSQSGKLVTVSNFREDVNVDGFIDAIDTSVVKSKSGTALP